MVGTKTDRSVTTKGFMPEVTRRGMPVVLVMMVVAVGCGRQGSSSSSGPASREAICGGGGIISEGERLPLACTVEELSTRKMETVADVQAGRLMVINFWASWCPYCIDEMPDFQRVYAQAAGRVQFLGRDLLSVQGETRSAARELAKTTGVRYPLAFDDGAILYGHVVPRLLMPTTLLVKADGTVAYRQFGPLDAVKLRKLLKAHLNIDLGGDA